MNRGGSVRADLKVDSAAWEAELEAAVRVAKRFTRQRRATVFTFTRKARTGRVVWSGADRKTGAAMAAVVHRGVRYYGQEIKTVRGKRYFGTASK